MGRVIAIANQKGGVGKTVTTLNLGIGLANCGKKVLLIDSDSQGSLTVSMGISSPDKLDKSFANVIAKVINDESFDIDDYIVSKRDRDNIVSERDHVEFCDFVSNRDIVDLLPGNIELSAMEVSLVGAFSRETVFKQIIELVRDRYDFILIDCMPSLGMLTINALTCADSVLIPVQASYLPVKGLQQLISTLGRIKRQLNPNLEIEGILFTMVDIRTNLSRDVMEQLKDAYSRRIHFFESFIPMSVRLAEISTYGTDIFGYCPKGKAAVSYKSLVQEVL